MTPKPTDERSWFERAGEAAHALKDIVWALALVGAAFGLYVRSMVVPLEQQLAELRAEQLRQREVVEEAAALWVDTDSTLHREHLERLRRLRGFAGAAR